VEYTSSIGFSMTLHIMMNYAKLDELNRIHGLFSPKFQAQSSSNDHFLIVKEKATAESA
jgi:hypothetical protein